MFLEQKTVMGAVVWAISWSLLPSLLIPEVSCELGGEDVLIVEVGFGGVLASAQCDGQDLERSSPRSFPLFPQHGVLLDPWRQLLLALGYDFPGRWM